MAVTEFYPDIFNDVYGPLMQPGSSSHTAGPCRLGLLANIALRETPSHIKVVLDKDGSFAGTFGHMNEDIGMLSGAYGLYPDDPEMFSIKEILKEKNIPYEFEFSKITESSHSNAVKFILTGKTGRTVTLTGNSTGGGMVEVVELCGFNIYSRGETHSALIIPDAKEHNRTAGLKNIFSDLEGVYSVKEISSQDDKYAIYLEAQMNFDAAALKAAAGVNCDIFMLSPILPVPQNSRRKPQLFDSVTKWREIADRENKSLYEVALDYEINATGWERKAIESRMEHIADTMEKQAMSVYNGDTDLLETPFSGFFFREWDRYYGKSAPLSGNITSKALRYAFGAQSQSKGVTTVPGPMGNGGAYVYSVLKAISEERNIPEEKLIQALTVAGIIGALAYTRSDPTGEVTGCTGECGICAAMAAAGATELSGGEPRQVEAAASLTLQAMIGLPCDPIPGGENQPCTSRVVSAITLAITFADLALSGRNPVVPFHEVLDVADSIGKALPESLKCTSRGGMCSSPAAKSCRERFEMWHKEQ